MRSRTLPRHCIALCMAVLCETLIAGAERHALILCNQNYKSVGVLKTPLAEAKEAEKTLGALGFQGNITIVADATTAKMTEAVDAFAAKLSKSDVALFFYGGHAVQAGGENYLLGIDSDPSTTSQLAYKALPLGRVLTNLEGSGARLNLLILDCCRDNPLAATGRSIGSTRGLAPTANAPKGTFIAYAADANQQAWDDHGSIGLYGSVLFEKMKTPGLRLEDIFIQTREEVAKIATEKYKHQQEPAEYSKVSGAFYFVPGGAAQAMSLVPSVAAPADADYARFAGKTAGERKLIEVAAGVTVPFRWCPAGTFAMGSPTGEQEKLEIKGVDKRIFQTEWPHSVTLSKGFWLAETEVTQGQWLAVMGSTLLEQVKLAMTDESLVKLKDRPQKLREIYGFSKSTDPATMIGVQSDKVAMYWVNDHEAEDWCAKASRYFGQRGWAITLPTEAQWEYGCRAGTKGMTYVGDFDIKGEKNAPGLDTICWNGGNSSEGYSGQGWDTSGWKEKQYPGGYAGPRRVGGKQANEWGLNDMIGNVFEWCADFFSPYATSGVTDPPAAPIGAIEIDLRIARGGSWFHEVVHCRAAARYGFPPGFRNRFLGFRPSIVHSK